VRRSCCLLMELTHDIIAKVDARIREGLSRERALRAAGVPPSVYRQWFKLGKDGVQPYAQWLNALEEAEANAEDDRVQKIRDNKDWKAQAWLLERRYPERWGQKIQLEVRREVERVLDAAEKILPTKLYEKLLAQIAEDDGSKPGDQPPSSPAIKPDQLN